MLYAQSPARRTRQLIGDVLVLVWAAAWIAVGRILYRAINALQGPTTSISNSANSLGNKVAGLNDSLPGFLQKPLNGVSGDSESLSNAAASQSETIHHLALTVGFVVALIPILLLLAVVVPGRLRWMQDAAAIRDFHGIPHVRQLLAQRALVHQPLRKLAEVSSDPVGDFHRGEFDALAKLEADRLGFDLPDHFTPPSPPKELA